MGVTLTKAWSEMGINHFMIGIKSICNEQSPDFVLLTKELTKDVNSCQKLLKST